MRNDVKGRGLINKQIQRTSMKDGDSERKLAVLVAIDVVGYSKSIERNEEKTIATLRKYRAILDPMVKRMGGRIFNTGGDSVFAEFGSAVQALKCATRFQRDIHKKNCSLKITEQMFFRVGVNLGDVIEDDDNLLGDGVNVAARLESICQPSGVCISKAIYDLVKDKVDEEFHDIGLQKVKENQFHAFDILINETKRRQRKDTHGIPKKISLAVLVIVAATTAVFFLLRSSLGPEDAEIGFPLPTKPSLIVLPFKNLSGDPAKIFIAEGIAENITSQISRSSDVFVISNNSAKKVAGMDLDSSEIADAVGVRYLMSGSVQEAAGSLRVNVELIDAIEDRIVWVDKFSGQTEQLFEFQDLITESIFKNLQINFMSKLGGSSNHGSHWSSIEEMRLFGEGRRHLLKWTSDAHNEMERVVNEVYAGPQSSGPAHLLRGWLYFQKVMMEGPERRELNITEGRRMAQLAFEIMQTPNPLVLGAWFDLYDRSYDAAQQKVTEAAAMGSPTGDMLAVGGTVYLLSMKPLEAKKMLAEAMRISPFHPAWYANRYATSLAMLGENDEAKKVAQAIFKKAKSGEIFALQGSRALVTLALIADRENEPKKARGYVNEIMQIQPAFTQQELDKQLGMLKDQSLLAEYKKLLNKYGLPKD
ncbi:MAG: hypothetical protein CMD99_05350 [Gammaproteobacteria bacterium]|nr:hypothetical protein [Gammaproteobacteria bacterium]